MSFAFVCTEHVKSLRTLYNVPLFSQPEAEPMVLVVSRESVEEDEDTPLELEIRGERIAEYNFDLRLFYCPNNKKRLLQDEANQMSIDKDKIDTEQLAEYDCSEWHCIVDLDTGLAVGDTDYTDNMHSNWIDAWEEAYQ